MCKRLIFSLKVRNQVGRLFLARILCFGVKSGGNEREGGYGRIGCGIEGNG